VNDLLNKVVNHRGIRVARSLVTHRGVAKLIDGNEKPGVTTATGPARPTGQILGATSNVSNSAASVDHIWPDADWRDQKVASAL
jgi:hypothetical protein